jgi:UDP-2,4-diacetamido-2,4,6-trideoxy-beta-L-altropyranose hydrolase
MTVRHAVFRADASPEVGIGHVVRCRTLAEALVGRGWTATLATRDLPAGLVPSLTEAGVEILELGPGSTPSAEAEAANKGMDRAITLLVADHYDLGAAWFDVARDGVDVLMAIDDLADRPLPVDLLLNQNLGAEAGQYRGLVSPGARVLTGPSYALVGRAFAERRASARTRTGHVDRVLVFLSGADPADVTAIAVSALEDIEVSVDVVVGAAYSHLESLRALVARHPAMELHVNVDTMAELMDRADLAIGAPSSASWERCALGLPTVLVALADNQSTVGRLLVERGAAVMAGWHATVSPAMIRDLIVSLSADPAHVREMSRAAAAVTDGHGTDRVVAEIERLAAARTEAP